MTESVASVAQLEERQARQAWPYQTCTCLMGHGFDSNLSPNFSNTHTHTKSFHFINNNNNDNNDNNNNNNNDNNISK